MRPFDEVMTLLKQGRVMRGFGNSPFPKGKTPMQELDQQRRMRMSREGTKPPTLRTSSIQELEGDNVLDPETGQMIPDFLEDGSPNPAAGPTATIKSMRPFDHAWRLLKSYTSEPPLPPGIEALFPRAHVVSPASVAATGGVTRMGRPTEFENRQFNVKNIDDEDTRGRVRDTRQELEAANFSTGQDMSDRLSASERAAQEGDADDHDYRPKIDGMRVNENPDYPSLPYDDMSTALRYPYPKDANNPGDFAGGY